MTANLAAQSCSSLFLAFTVWFVVSAPRREPVSERAFAAPVSLVRHAARSRHHHARARHRQRPLARPRLRPPLALVAEPRSHAGCELGHTGRRSDHAQSAGHERAAADRRRVDGADQAALPRRSAAAESRPHPAVPDRPAAAGIQRRRSDARPRSRPHLRPGLADPERHGSGHRTDYHDRPHRDVRAERGRRLRLVADPHHRAADDAGHGAGESGDRPGRAGHHHDARRRRRRRRPRRNQKAKATNDR